METLLCLPSKDARPSRARRCAQIPGMLPCALSLTCMQASSCPQVHARPACPHLHLARRQLPHRQTPMATNLLLLSKATALGIGNRCVCLPGMLLTHLHAGMAACKSLHESLPKLSLPHAAQPDSCLGGREKVSPALQGHSHEESQQVSLPSWHGPMHLPMCSLNSCTTAGDSIPKATLEVCPSSRHGPAYWSMSSMQAKSFLQSPAS